MGIQPGSFFPDLVQLRLGRAWERQDPFQELKHSGEHVRVELAQNVDTEREMVGSHVLEAGVGGTWGEIREFERVLRRVLPM